MNVAAPFRWFFGRMSGNLRGDVFGGITAGVVALPLALGMGVASGLPNGAAAGLYGAIILGIVASLFGGTPVQVSGPTGPMTVVVAAVAMQLQDPPLVFTAILLGGALQIVFGLLKLGRFITYIPYPVVSGYLTGIGVIVISLQSPALLGHEAQANPVDGLAATFRALGDPNLSSLFLAAGTVAIIYLVPRLTSRVPGTLVALFVMTVVGVVLDLDVPRIASIPAGLPTPQAPPFERLFNDFEAMRAVATAAVALAALGSIDTLLTGVIVDRLLGGKHDGRLELIGQGLGNMASAMAGGLAGSGATMRTLVNLRTGGRTHLSGVIHGFVLLGVLLGLGRAASAVPLSVLAGILITVGVGIVDWRGLRHAVRAPRGDAAVMLLVLVLTVFSDLVLAVTAGTLLSALLMAKEVGDLATPTAGAPAAKEEAKVLRLQGPLFFGNAQALYDAASRLERPKQVIVAMDGVSYVDQSGAYALGDVINSLREKGAEVWLTGVPDAVQTVLERLDVAADQLHPQRSPLVLVPVANPQSVPILTQVAASLSPPRIGRVLLLNIRTPKQRGAVDANMGEALTSALDAAASDGGRVEVLATLAPEPWPEIARVARAHRCDVTLVGTSDLASPAGRARLEALSAALPGSLAVLCARPGWDPTKIQRVVVATGGRGGNGALRARLLAALISRIPTLDVSYALVVSPEVPDVDRKNLATLWTDRARLECPAVRDVKVVASDDPAAALLERAADADMLVLGLERSVQGRAMALGDVTVRVASEAPCAVLLIGQRD